MPQIGDICKGTEIGRESKSAFYIWSRCLGCGEERWVFRRKGVAISSLCCSCGHIGIPAWNKGLHNWQTEKHRLHRLKAITGRKRTSEELEKQSQSHMGHVVSQEVREKLRQFHLGRKHTLETKAKMSRQRKGKPTWLKGLTKETSPSVAKIAQAKAGRKLNRPQWNTGLTKETHEGLAKAARIKSITEIGSNNPNWKGGLSFLPYTPAFNGRLKESIRCRDGYICQYPGCRKPENGVAHDIHHIDYDKGNNSSDNLVTLCRVHNGMVNKNRLYWRTYFIELLLKGGIS